MIFYQIGDIVRLRGYGGEIFEILGYFHTKLITKDGVDEDVTYMLIHVSTGEKYDGAYEDIELVKRKPKVETREIDVYLDIYNDMMALYKAFNDDHYRVVAENTLNKLKRQLEKEK